MTATLGTARKARGGSRDEPSADLVTHREAADLLDEETLRRVLAHGKHYHTGGRWPRPYWLRGEFAELLDLVEIESSRGGPL